MKKVLMFLAALTMLTACGSDIEYTEPDNKTDEIQFSIGSIDAPAIGMARAVSRAEHGHVAWSDAKHANTLGVFGYYDGNLENEIFSNQKVTRNASKWTYEPAKYWAEFSNASSFDFFGYMVEGASSMPDASVTNDGNKYTLTFAANIGKPVLTSPDNTPLICHAPYHTAVVGMSIPFQMDQTLTGYTVYFQLGEKMDRIRDFVIKGVKVYGNNLPVGGNVSRTYTLTDGVWTAGNVIWENLSTASIAKDAAIALAKSWPTDDNKDDRTINNTTTDWVKWGGEGLTDGAFYALPSASFVPTIEVTYDVYSEGGTLTRKDVKSTIVLNKTNFADLAVGTTGEIQKIKIKIVPDYLYVLSDDDQVTGFLIATE